MSGFSDRFEYDILQLLLCAKPITNIADNAGSSPSTAIWVALHTASPADDGTQGTNEVGLTAYTRIAVARTTGGFVVTSGSSATKASASPVSAIDFPTLTSTSTGTATHASLGLSSAATAGVIIAHGALSVAINLGQNVTPRITTASSFTLE